MYYNSHGNDMLVRTFINVEVKERGNTELETVKQWMKAYDFSAHDRCIWVTKTKKEAVVYSVNAGDREDVLILQEDEVAQFCKLEGIEEPYEYTEEQGYIIPESDDGDGGFLFIFKNK